MLKLTTHARTLSLATSACLALSLGACANSASSDRGRKDGRHQGGAAQDLAALQGRWEQLPEEPGPGSPRQRVVKEVSGNTETVTTYNADGRSIHSQTAQFRLSREGGVPLYTFSGARITADAGERPPEGPRSYLYKLRGPTFYEVWGLLPGQEEREVLVRRWKRLGPPGT